MRYHIDCTKFTRDNIVAMLEDRGYNETSEDIYAVEYVSTSMQNGQVKYKIKFNEDGIGQTGYVYIFIDTDGKLVCDY